MDDLLVAAASADGSGRDDVAATAALTKAAYTFVTTNPEPVTFLGSTVPQLMISTVASLVAALRRLADIGPPKWDQQQGREMRSCGQHHTSSSSSG